MPSSPTPLSNRIALVTGASRGLGAATALALARAGAHVVAVARTVGGLEELDDAIRAAGGAATLVPLNATDSEGLVRLGVALREFRGLAFSEAQLPHHRTRRHRGGTCVARRN